MTTPPWKRKSPAKKSTPLTPAQKKAARARAARAGRPYPNLVDNMYVAAQAKSAKSAKSKPPKS